MADLPKPDYATNNMRLVGYSDQGGRCDGVQIMVHRGYAYIGHIFSKGFSVVDVRDPKQPKLVKYIAAPSNTWTLHLQVFDDLLLVINNKDMFAQPELADEKNYYKGSVDHHAKAETATRNWTAGLAVYDISKGDDPKQIGFMPVEGTGLHRLWYVGGRWAYASALLDGFSDYILITIDMADPKQPKLAGKYWLPGMNVAAGEKANWPTKNGRHGLHHAIIHDDIAYCSWRDACLAVVDETVLDNQEDGFKPIWVFDNQVKSNPISISTFPAPSEKDYLKVGGHFGPHNVHENRPGSFQSSELIFATYQNAGLRAYDIRDQFRPKEVAAFVPPPPQKWVDPRPNRPIVLHSADVFVDKNALCYVTDFSAGLYIVEYRG